MEVGDGMEAFVYCVTAIWLVAQGNHDFIDEMILVSFSRRTA